MKEVLENKSRKKVGGDTSEHSISRGKHMEKGQDSYTELLQKGKIQREQSSNTSTG